jgi:hypothetical protein
VAGRPGFAAPIVVANEEHRFVIAEQLRQIGTEPAALLLEPIGRNTGPAAAVAALRVAESAPDGLVLLMPSDHAIADAKAFYEAIQCAARAAKTGRLVTFGITPDRAETGYAISPGERRSRIARTPLLPGLSRNQGRRMPSAMSRLAVISGTAASSCSRRQCISTSWSGCGPTCWPHARMRSPTPKPTPISSVSTRQPLQSAPATRSTTPSWSTRAAPPLCRSGWGGAISAPGTRCGR